MRVMLNHPTIQTLGCNPPVLSTKDANSFHVLNVCLFQSRWWRRRQVLEQSWRWQILRSWCKFAQTHMGYELVTSIWEELLQGTSKRTNTIPGEHLLITLLKVSTFLVIVLWNKRILGKIWKIIHNTFCKKSMACHWNNTENDVVLGAVMFELFL